MHKLESFANNLGLKLKSEPSKLEENYFPTPIKYIVIDTGSDQNTYKYNYFDKIASFIFNILDRKDIKIIRLGCKHDTLIKNTLDLREKLSFLQEVYVVKNSLCYICLDSYGMHIANFLQKKIVALFGPTLPNVSGPYFKNDNIKILESHRNGKKASLSLQDPHNTINLIKPEEVANAIFELLGLDNKIKIETTQIGKFNHIPLLEIDLSEKPSIQLKAINSLSLRLDWCDNLELAYSLINSLDCGVSLVINKPTDLAFLNASKNKITQILYEINSIKDVDINYIKNLYSFGKTQIITDLENEDLNDLKFALFDYFSVASKLKHEPIKSEGLFFTNEGGVLKGDKKYPTKWHLDNEIYNESGEYEVPNTEEKSFWQYKEFLHFYQKTV